MRDPKAELYLTAVSTKLEPTFYEKVERARRGWSPWSGASPIEDPEWVLRFVTWLRRTPTCARSRSWSPPSSSRRGWTPG